MGKINVAITGASGFIAHQIRNTWNSDKFEFLALNRNHSDEAWSEILSESHVVINLAGAPVFQAWNKKNKKQILESRINTTKRLVKLLNELPEDAAPRLLISGSATGYYPNEGEDILDEYSNKLGNNFLSDVVQQWEAEAKKLNQQKTRLIIARIGVVLGNEGGIVETMKPIFNLGLGGKIASGKQAFSFIHIDDLLAAFLFFIKNKTTTGIYNMVSPMHTNNLRFTKAFGKVLKRPVLFPIPAFVLKLVYGQSAEIMINGEKVYPRRLLEDGFEFQYPEIENALKQLCK